MCGAAVSGDVVSGDAVSGNSVSGDAVRGDAVSGEDLPGDVVSGDAVRGDIVRRDAMSTGVPIADISASSSSEGNGSFPRLFCNLGMISTIHERDQHSVALARTFFLSIGAFATRRPRGWIQG